MSTLGDVSGEFSKTFLNPEYNLNMFLEFLPGYALNSGRTVPRMLAPQLLPRCHHRMPGQLHPTSENGPVEHHLITFRLSAVLPAHHAVPPLRRSEEARRAEDLGRPRPVLDPRSPVVLRAVLRGSAQCVVEFGCPQRRRHSKGP